MLTVVCGENGSGKSVFAENFITTLGSLRVYIATLRPYGEEGRLRVEKHRRQRADLGFTTLELDTHVSAAPLLPNSVVLLEDASNLLANAMFLHHADTQSVLDDILRLRSRCKALVVVTISRFAQGDYDNETANYIHAMAALNEQLFAHADCVVELQDGHPVIRKGQLDATV